MGGSSNPVKAVVDAVAKPVTSVVGTGVKAVGDVIGEVDRISGTGGIHLDPFVKQKEEAKEEARRDAKQQAEAQAKQKADAEAQIKVKAANKEAGAGSSIILGGKKKKDRKGSVSSGMGLSKGATGLQA